MSLFDLLGGVLGLYVVYAAIDGKVYAKHRAWGRSWSRAENPAQFWTIIAIYTALAIALVVGF